MGHIDRENWDRSADKNQIQTSGKPILDKLQFDPLYGRFNQTGLSRFIARRQAYGAASI